MIVLPDQQMLRKARVDQIVQLEHKIVDRFEGSRTIGAKAAQFLACAIFTCCNTFQDFLCWQQGGSDGTTEHSRSDKQVREVHQLQADWSQEALQNSQMQGCSSSWRSLSAIRPA